MDRHQRQQQRRQQRRIANNTNNNNNSTYRTERSGNDVSDATGTLPPAGVPPIREGSRSMHSSITSVNNNISNNSHNWMAVPSQVNVVHNPQEVSTSNKSSKNKKKSTATSNLFEETIDTNNNTMEENPYKITRKQAIQTLLDDEELCDLQLRSMIDHQIVYAQRGWLASRSLVFRSLLFGKFKESKQTIIDLPYTSKVLRTIVEFIYSDDTSLFHTKSSSSNTSRKKNVELLETIVSVVDAGNYFALPELVEKTEQYTKTLLEQDESLVCLLLTATSSAVGDCDGIIGSFDNDDGQHSTTTTTAMSTISSSNNMLHYYSIPMAIIRSNPKLLLEENSSLESMTSSQLEFVLRDKQLNAEEYDLFKILHKWQKNGQVDTTAADDDDTKPNTRLQDAMRLSKLIKFEYINPMELSTVVATSGIISMEQLTNAYKEQAIRAQQHHHVSYQKLRSSKPVWYSSNTCKVTCSNPTNSGDWSIELLQLSKPLMSHRTSSSRNKNKKKKKTKDIYKWKIYINKDCQDTWLGVAEVSASSSTNNESISTIINDNSTWLGGQSIGYIYGSSGWAWNNDQCMKRNLPTFTQGLTVTFILDLSTTSSSANASDSNSDGDHENGNGSGGGGGGGNGTLRASLDDGVTMFDLFTNMLGDDSNTTNSNGPTRNNNYSIWNNDDENNGAGAGADGNDDSRNTSKAFVPAAFLRHPGEVTFLGFE